MNMLEEIFKNNKATMQNLLRCTQATEALEVNQHLDEQKTLRRLLDNDLGVMGGMCALIANTYAIAGLAASRPDLLPLREAYGSQPRSFDEVTPDDYKTLIEAVEGVLNGPRGPQVPQPQPPPPNAAGATQGG